MNRIKIVSIVLLTALVMTGCANSKSTGYTKNDEGPKVDLVAELKKSYTPLYDKTVSPLDKDRPIIYASFANIDNLSLSSTFGRVASEIISSGLTERGYNVVEVKMRDSLFIKQEAGEFILSRNLRYLSQEHDAQAVVLGTYAVGGRNIYINARVVRALDSVVLSSHDFVLPLNQDIKHMLGLR